MATKVKGIDEQKLFKIGRLNIKRKAKEWFKKLDGAQANWHARKTTMFSKYGIVNKEEIKVKLDLESNKNQNEGFKFTMTGWKSFLEGVNWRIQNREKSLFLNFILKF